MDKTEQVKNIYKSIVSIFLHTHEEITFWESQRAMLELPSLFPDINFDEFTQEVDDYAKRWNNDGKRT